MWLVVVSGTKMVDDLRRRPDEEVSFMDGSEEVLPSPPHETDVPNFSAPSDDTNEVHRGSGNRRDWLSRRDS